MTDLPPLKRAIVFASPTAGKTTFIKGSCVRDTDTVLEFRMFLQNRRDRVFETYTDPNEAEARAWAGVKKAMEKAINGSFEHWVTNQRSLGVGYYPVAFLVDPHTQARRHVVRNEMLVRGEGEDVWDVRHLSHCQDTFEKNLAAVNSGKMRGIEGYVILKGDEYLSQALIYDRWSFSVDTRFNIIKAGG